MKPARKILAADLFCGAGGFTTGCEQALARLGFEVELFCVNHWPIAINTQSLNHPNAIHICQDLALVRPGHLVKAGYLDLLAAAPSCTHHSLARGGKPTSDQQRADPWHIIPWLTELDVHRLLIENVWEFIKWGPVDPATCRPVKGREGEYFRAWIDLIRRLGYAPEWRKLNAADFGGATTRQRFILMAKKARKSVSWPPVTHGKTTAVPWRPARDVIDWTIKGRSIFNRPVPLAPKTLARVLAGVIKFGWPAIFVIMLRRELERSLRYQVRLNFAKRHSAKADVRRRCGKRVYDCLVWLRDLREAAGDAGGGDAAAPMLVTLRNHADGRSVGLPVPALAANGGHIALAEPIILNGRKNNKARPAAAAPVPALDTKGGIWLAEPFILNRHGENGGVRAHDVNTPMPAADCRGAGYVVESFVLSQASGGSPRAASEPLPTAVAGGAIAMISPYYGSGSGETCSTVQTPLPTATAKARFGLVIPITHSDGSNRARDVETDPLPTLTTAHRGELALVTGDDVADGAVQFDILFRMLQSHELAGAMGFNNASRRYQFAGNKTEQVKQIGNAISVELADACITAIMDDHPDVLARAAKVRRPRAAPAAECVA